MIFRLDQVALNQLNKKMKDQTFVSLNDRYLFVTMVPRTMIDVPAQVAKCVNHWTVSI